MGGFLESFHTERCAYEGKYFKLLKKVYKGYIHTVMPYLCLSLSLSVSCELGFISKNDLFSFSAIRLSSASLDEKVSR